MTTFAARPGMSAIRIAEVLTRQAVNGTPASTPPGVMRNRTPHLVFGLLFTTFAIANTGIPALHSDPEKNKRTHEPRPPGSVGRHTDSTPALFAVGGRPGADVAEVADLPGAQHQLLGRQPGRRQQTRAPIKPDAVAEAGNPPLGAELPVRVGLVTPVGSVG